MAINISAMSAVLKTRYIGTIREQLNHATVLLDKIGRQDQMVSGTTFVIPLHTRRTKSAGIGISDGGTLPTADGQTYATSTASNKFLYGRLQVTGPVIAATRDNLGAFVQALESEVDGLQRDFKRYMNRQLHSDGTDALGFWTTADDTSGATIDDGQGNPFIFLEAGATTCDLIDASDHTSKVGNSIVVTRGAKASTNWAVTWTGTVTGSADGDYLVLEDTLGNQMQGIRGIIDNGNPPLGALQSIDATTAGNEYWQAQVFGNSGTLRALSFDDMQEVQDSIDSDTDYSSSDANLLLSNYPIRRAYYKLCIAERRQVNTMELDGGWKALDWNGIGWVVDNMCRRNVIYFINTETMKIYRTSDFDWMDKDGSYLSRVANVDAYEAVLFHYGNLVCLSRNGNGLLEDLIEA